MGAAPIASRRLAAIVVADVVGYSRLLAEDETGTLAALRERRKAVVEPLVKSHAGRVVKFLGDGVLIEFSSAVNAVAFALDLQRRMAELNEPVAESRRILLRIGINLGEVVGEGSDIYGDGVNIAARLEALAEPGGIVVSAKVHDEVRGKLDIRAEDLGGVALKNILAPVRCWRIAPFRVSEAAANAPAGRAGERITIAVLPFTNMSGDASQEYFVDGLTEDLITALSKFRLYSVLSRNSTFQFKGRAVDVQNVGRQLGARYVLEGSIRTGGNRLRINAQLIDAESGAHVWAEKFDRELADVFAVQDEIVAAISGQLYGVVIDAAVVSRQGASVANLTAYDHFLRGRSAWRRGAALETIENWTRSVAADPTYAPALASLAFFYAEDTWMQTLGKPIAELERLAIDYAEKAIAADNADAFVQHMVGTAFLDIGEVDSAKQHLELSLTLNPHIANTTINLGFASLLMGDHREGLELIAKGVRIDPRLPPAMQAVPFIAQCILGNAAEAKSCFTSIQNPFAYCHLILAACLARVNYLGEAKRELAHFEAKRTPTFDVKGFALLMARGMRLGADRERFLDGFRKLGIDV
jgi:TolB-like protein/class 3 adenylate cyclase